jgi:pyridoxal 5'-phosphate synthase pdxT subunit
MYMLIGILAIQGGYAPHGAMLNLLGIKYAYIRTAEKLNTCDALIIPGGESTTLLCFMRERALWRAIKDFAAKKKPIFGTCAGAILLANQVVHPSQESLKLIDVTIERNSYGRQIASCVAQGVFLPKQHQTEMVFIRAPRIKSIGKKVTTLGRCNDQIVCAQQNKILIATFHPELSTDLSWHEYFINLI